MAEKKDEKKEEKKPDAVDSDASLPGDISEPASATEDPDK
jgi:hypothetical protein